ncbi:hypothetical protein Aperf_G00000038182 [Anoplocephala perfoliata]
MSSTALSPQSTQIRQENELKTHIEVLKSYWKRCLIKSSQYGGDNSEMCCYVMLIAKLLKKEQFAVTNAVPNYHILFESALELDMFYQICGLLTKYHGENLETLKETVLQFYDVLLSCPHYNLFLKEEFLVPMMATLNFCSHHSSLRIENIFLQTLHTVCAALSQHLPTSNESDSSPLREDLFWSICLNPCVHIQKFNSDNSEDTIPSPEIFADSVGEMQSLCDLLVNYVHREGSLCWLSRDSLLLLAASSASNENAGYHMANDSNLCEVLVTDIVVLFTNIPRQLISTNSVDEWPNLLSYVECQLLKDHPLERFLNLYEFCCSILDMSNYVVKENMLNCLYKGFLLPVLAPEIQSTNELELATATIYLDQILLKSKGSILLPFLLRFLFSDRNITHSNRLTPQSFRQGITQALEQSFPLSEPSFFRGNNMLTLGGTGSTYMDLLLKRIQAPNSLVGIATLSLMNTIFDLLCEDATFELILNNELKTPVFIQVLNPNMGLKAVNISAKSYFYRRDLYLLLGPHAELNKSVSNPSSFFDSAGQYLALIPPYSSPSLRSVNVLDELQLQSGSNGDLSSIKIDQYVMEKVNSDSNLGLNEFQRRRRDCMRDFLLEARNLIAERKAACSYWRFPYDIGNPSPSMVSNAHMNEDLLTPLPQEGLQSPEDDTLDNQASEVASKSQTNTDRNQWELDGLSQMVTEDDNILADLERFSALLREPTHIPTYNRNSATQNSKRTSAVKLRRHRHKDEEAPDSEEIKRTSSLYDITFVEMDPDEITGSTENNGVNLPPHIHPNRMVKSALVRRPSTPSSASPTSPTSLELSLTESSEQLPFGVEEITKQGGVPHLMRYLDHIPGGGGECVNGEAIEDRFAACMRQYEEKKVEGRDNGANVSEVLKEMDSGFTSADSALLKTSTTAATGSSSVDVAPFYPGPFLTTILKLLNDIPSNHLYTNLQLTRLVTHLMALPLPLIRLQLLPLSTHEARSLGGQQRLYTTLTAVRQRFDCYVNLYFPTALVTGSGDAIAFVRMIGHLRDAVFSIPRPQSFKLRAPSSSAVESPRRISRLLSRLRLISLPTAPTPASSAALKSTTVSSTAIAGDKRSAFEWRAQAMHQLGGIFSDKNGNLGLLKSVKDEKSRGVLVALFVFEEFCRELAALCLEHSVAL